MTRIPNRANRRGAVAAHRRAKDPWVWEGRPERPAIPILAFGTLVRALVNARYSVQVYERESELGVITHLALRRHDNGTVIPWSDLQRVKDEVAGADRLAIEVFPPADQLVDDANMFHLWVLPRGFVLPFGLNGGLVG